MMIDSVTYRIFGRPTQAAADALVQFSATLASQFGKSRPFARDNSNLANQPALKRQLTSGKLAA